MLTETKLFPHIKYVMDKFKGKLPKDDLKRFAKEVRSYSQSIMSSLTYGRCAKISKKLVSSDFKNNRVEDPTKISSRQEKHVKKYVKEYFDKAVAKKREHEKKKAERRGKEGESAASPVPAMAADVKKEDSDGDQDMAMSDDDEDGEPKPESATPVTPSDQLLQAERLKRKRMNDEDPDNVKLEDKEATPSKRHKSESPPPPPPPPPADGTPPNATMLSEGDDVNRYRYTANQSLGDMESMRMLPEEDSDTLRQHATSNDRTSAIRGDDDVSGIAHTPDAPMEYEEHEGLFGSKGQRHLSDIEVHGAA